MFSRMFNIYVSNQMLLMNLLLFYLGMNDNYDDDMLMVMSFLSMIWPAVCWLSFAHLIPVYLIIFEETSEFFPIWP